MKFQEKNILGYLVVIYDPTRIRVAVTKYIGTAGQYLTRISEEENALVAINGGGFVDPTGGGTGRRAFGNYNFKRKINS